MRVAAADATEEVRGAVSTEAVLAQHLRTLQQLELTGLNAVMERGLARAVAAIAGDHLTQHRMKTEADLAAMTAGGMAGWMNVHDLDRHCARGMGVDHTNHKKGLRATADMARAMSAVQVLGIDLAEAVVEEVRQADRFLADEPGLGQLAATE